MPLADRWPSYWPISHPRARAIEDEIVRAASTSLNEDVPAAPTSLPSRNFVRCLEDWAEEIRPEPIPDEDQVMGILELLRERQGRDEGYTLDADQVMALVEEINKNGQARQDRYDFLRSLMDALDNSKVQHRSQRRRNELDSHRTKAVDEIRCALEQGLPRWDGKIYKEGGSAWLQWAFALVSPELDEVMEQLKATGYPKLAEFIGNCEATELTNGDSSLGADKSIP